MNKLLISLMLAGGVGVFVYSRIGRRIGYGNEATVWKATIGSVVVAFLFFLSLLVFALPDTL